MSNAEARQRNWDQLVSQVVDGPGQLDPAVRRAVFDGAGDVPERLAGFVDTVVRHAYRVTDGQMDDLKRAGLSEDEIFEATVVAAMAAGERRLRIARRAMGGD